MSQTPPTQVPVSDSAPAAVPPKTDGGSLLGGFPAPGDVNTTLLGSNDQIQKPEDGDTPPSGALAAQEPQPGTPGVGLVPLPDTASDDQKRDFQNKLRALQGVPNAPGDYGDFGFGKEIKIDTNGEDYKYYTDLFHKVGLSKSQAKQLLEAHKRYADKEVERIQKTNDQAITEYRSKVKGDFVKSLGGESAYEVYRLDAERGFKAVAKGAKLNETEVKGLLSIMGDDPRFVKMFNHVGKNFKEDVLVMGAMPSAPEPTIENIFEGMFKHSGG